LNIGRGVGISALVSKYEYKHFYEMLNHEGITASEFIRRAIEQEYEKFLKADNERMKLRLISATKPFSPSGVNGESDVKDDTSK
jgi:hypothetical protein